MCHTLDVVTTHLRDMEPMSPLHRTLGVSAIWSGGQTGVDRAALDVALELGIDHGGWIPRGRLAEDGVIPDRYTALEETESSDYHVRTERNVRDADATLIVQFGPSTGGTHYTRDVAVALGKPALVIDAERLAIPPAVDTVRSWLRAVGGGIRLNVAGPRLSSDPRAYKWTRALLLSVFKGS